MKKIYSLIALAITSFGFAQTTVQGTFVKVESLADLVDGQYVIANETNEFVMTSGRSGSASTGFYLSEDIVLTDNNIVDPSETIVWTIATTSTGKTIQSNSTNVYVGWSSGNSASAVTTVTASSTWTFTYADNKFTVSNVSTPARQLSYNAQNPRFAAYGNNGQEELQFYKLVEEETPVEPVAPTAVFSATSLPAFTYAYNEGPSATQTVDVTIANLPEGQTATLAVDNTDFAIVTPTEAVGNGTHTITLQLVSGLAIGAYEAHVAVMNGTTEVGTGLDITGNVTEPALGNTKNEIEGLRIYPNPANDIVTISSNTMAVKSVQLFDVTGKQIMNVETSSTINVSSLAKGIYVMKVTEEGKTSTSKLIIK
jgi:hypothetical protein